MLGFLTVIDYSNRKKIVWVGEWVDVRVMGVKAVLRIACSNNKTKNEFKKRDIFKRKKNVNKIEEHIKKFRIKNPKLI